MPQFQKRLAVAGALALALSAGVAEAQEDVLAGLPSSVVQQLRPGVAIEQVIAQALGPIRQYDLDRNGIDSNDIAIAESVDAAGRRAAQVSTTLRYDLDGDSRVTENEVRRSLEFQQGRQMQQGVEEAQRRTMMERQLVQVLALDLDHDGSISIAEMLSAEDTGNRQPETKYESLRLLLLNDPNGDGRVTPAELEAIVRTAFAKVDANASGTIEMNEYAAYRSELQQIAAANKAAACKLPKAEADERVSVIGMYYADAQPTVTVTGQDDVTFLARIAIEPGTTPLYVVLNSYLGMVWKFEGQIDRLKHVVVMPSGARGTDGSSAGWAGAGVLGLPKELVTFTANGACGDTFYDPASAEGKAMQRRIARATGAGSVDMIGAYSPQGFSIPSGKPIAPQKESDVVVTGGGTYVMTEGEQPKLLEGGLTLKAQEDWMSKSGGIVEVKPEDVLAPGKVETYQVIPSQDGLRNMVERGILQRTDKGYRLLKPMPRWPAGISGSNSVTFILPKGMPMPKGSLGHSTVVTEP